MELATDENSKIEQLAV